MSEEVLVGPHKYEIVNWMDLISQGDGRCKSCKLPRFMHEHDDATDWQPARAVGDLTCYPSKLFKRVS